MEVKELTGIIKTKEIPSLLDENNSIISDIEATVEELY